VGFGCFPCFACVSLTRRSYNMIPTKIQEIWNMGSIKCIECGLMKAHCAKGMCNTCYHQIYQREKNAEKRLDAKADKI